jgi:hypothetical protein
MDIQVREFTDKNDQLQVQNQFLLLFLSIFILIFLLFVKLDQELGRTFWSPRNSKIIRMEETCYFKFINLLFSQSKRHLPLRVYIPIRNHNPNRDGGV